MKFEKFDPQGHSVEKVASLLYDVDFRTFNQLYKNKDLAIKDISKSLFKGGSEDFYVILDGGKIIGIIVFWIRKKPSFIHSLSKFTSFKLLAIDILDYFVLCDVEKDDLHVADLAISSECRGKGIGKKVLDTVIEYARKNNFKRVTLDADFRNEGAKRLYEKIGFEVFNKKEFLKRGMFNMEYVLEKEK
ncbi:MAG: GNAT family N-acetyltransferase [Methanobrevibacter sp.]|uniref:GNAT family N-acetyltransferase n=1 Tax=Methanobrevibacter sp. TaxID=66852 RepID=UPI0026DF78E5|nr:GNAT family N-acetyltransferase [Methanobrevibacter sp.]MDO5848046.1 GNAT family N-acetyltransferase [Methanobrevibacter sp.]